MVGGQQSLEKHVSVTHSQTHMACAFELTVECSERDTARVERILRDQHRRLEFWESRWSAFQPDSDVSRYRRGILSAMDPSTEHLLKVAQECERLTSGAFTTTPRGVLDFGAIGKGMALDMIRLELEQEGLLRFKLNAGGSSFVFRGGWEFAWKTSESQVLELETARETVCVGVSGIEEQGAHIVGAVSGRFSALVAGPMCAEADAFSTAAMKAGIHLSQSPGLEHWGIATVDCNHEIKCNNGMELWVRGSPRHRLVSQQSRP